MPQRQRANLSAEPTPRKALPSSSRASSPSTRWAAPLLLFVFALALRALPWPSVLTPEGLHFVGTDAYYHARRILHGLVRFPESLEFDRYINYPHGAKPIWAPLFDSLLTLLLAPFLDGTDTPALDRALVWVPPLLGAATVAATFVLARRRFDASVAWVAGGVLCVLSGHFWYSQIGFLDHHAAVALASVALLAATMRLIAAVDSPRASRPLAAVVAGATFAGCLLLWPGMLLHVGLATLGVFLCIAHCQSSESAARTSGYFAAANAVACALMLAFGGNGDWPQFSSTSPVVLSRFQPWLFGALAVQAAALHLLWRSGHGSTVARRAAHALLAGVLVLAMSALLMPDLASAGVDAWRWFAKQEHFQSMVSESRALFDVQGHFGVRIAETRLSRFLYLFPVALGLFAWRVWRRGPREQLVLVFWALGLAVATLLQKRFFNSFSIPLALLMGISVMGVARWLAARSGSGLAARVGVPAAVAVAVGWLLLPVYDAYEAPLRDQWKLLHGQQPDRVPAGPDLRTLTRSADWLRANTPTTRGFFDDTQPEYGVLALWGNGHVLEYVGRRPTVTNSFGDDIGGANFSAALRYFASKDEQSASQILDELRVRYVLAESLRGGRARARAPRGLMENLFDRDGNALTRHRLVFEAVAPAGSGSHAALKIFEHVPGAVVAGKARPGESVRVRLGYTTSRGRRGVYRGSTEANQQGEYRLRVPYATRGAPPSLRTDAAYELRIGDRAPRELVVHEADIQAGNEVAGPSVATLGRGAGPQSQP